MACSGTLMSDSAGGIQAVLFTNRTQPGDRVDLRGCDGENADPRIGS